MIISNKEIDDCLMTYFYKAHISVFLLMRQSQKRNDFISRYCIANTYRDLFVKYGKDVFLDGKSLNTQRVQAGALKRIKQVFLMTTSGGNFRASWDDKTGKPNYIDIFA